MLCALSCKALSSQDPVCQSLPSHSRGNQAALQLGNLSFQDPSGPRKRLWSGPALENRGGRPGPVGQFKYSGSLGILPFGPCSPGITVNTPKCVPAEATQALQRRAAGICVEPQKGCPIPRLWEVRWELSARASFFLYSCSKAPVGTGQRGADRERHCSLADLSGSKLSGSTQSLQQCS